MGSRQGIGLQLKAEANCAVCHRVAQEKMAAASISEKKEEKEVSAGPEAAQSKGHPLETGWTLWFDKTPHTSKPNSTTTYTDHLKNLGSFRTIEEFWDLYTRLTRPCDLTPTSHYHGAPACSPSARSTLRLMEGRLAVFREGYMPMWETFPKGGCWIIRFKKEKASHRPNVALGRAPCPLAALAFAAGAVTRAAGEWQARHGRSCCSGRSGRRLRSRMWWA
eukprot:2388739-Rhodomonas_salina.1